MASPAVQGTAQLTANTSASTSYVGNAPASIASGELLFAHIIVRSTATTNSITLPSGWTLIDGFQPGTAATAQVFTYWKLATGSEPATYTWTGTTSALNVVTIMRISGANTTNPIDGTPTHSTDSGSPTTHNFPAVVTSVADTLLICSFGSQVNGGTAGSWGTMTQQWYQATGTGTSQRTSAGGTEAIAAVGSTGARSMTTGSSCASNNQSVAIAPGAAAASLLIPADTVYRILSRR